MLHHERMPQLLKTLVVLLFLLTSLDVAFANTQRRGRAQRQPRASKQARQPAQAEDPINRSYSAVVKDAKVLKYSFTTIPAGAFTRQSAEPRAALETDKEPQREKIHPALKKRLVQLSTDEMETILISFQDDEEIPRFPLLNVGEPRDSKANKEVMLHAEELVGQIKERRRGDYQKLAAELRNLHRAEVIETFWLIKAVLVRMPLSSVNALAERADVSFVSAHKSDTPPPGIEFSLNNLLGRLSSGPLHRPSLGTLPLDSNPANDVQDGRARIMSDYYFNQGLTGGYIGLLDTGVRFYHTQFQNPSRIGQYRDCIYGNEGCWGGGGEESINCQGHGTSSAAIISANSNQGIAYRGVTGITLDSFKVYDDNFCGGSDVAVVRSFQAAVAAGDQVIVAEVQFPTSDTSTISLAADRAFDAGAVVIAANGNTDGSSYLDVRSPANAHKVIGVGAFNVQTLEPFIGQARGPAPDGRIKPDIVAPTDTETAGNASNTALRVHIKTSGAAPYAGGAAALVRNWLKRTSSTNDPGQVNAWLILSGQKPYPFDNTTGAGSLILPTNGASWWGKAQLQLGTTVDMPLPISGTTQNTLDAAIWWPESAFQSHTNLDLSLIDPNGVVRASSTSIPSVFERVRVAGPITSGTWKLRIKAHGNKWTPPFAQKVYWAAYVRPS